MPIQESLEFIGLLAGGFLVLYYALGRGQLTNEAIPASLRSFWFIKMTIVLVYGIAIGSILL